MAEEKLEGGMTVAEAQRKLAEFRHRYGVYPADAAHTILGDPTKGVYGPPPKKPEDEKKK